MYHASCIMDSRGLLHVLPTPFPRLVTNHPYSRSSALTRFLYGSLPHFTTHHHVLCRGVISRATMSSWTVYGYTYVGLLCMVVPPTSALHTMDITHPSPEHTIHTTRRYTHPYPSHSHRYPQDTGCRWPVPKPPLHRDGGFPSTF